MTPIAMFDQLRDKLRDFFSVPHAKDAYFRCCDCKNRIGTTVERTCPCHPENDNPEGDERHRAALRRHDELVRSFAPDDDPRFFE